MVSSCLKIGKDFYLERYLQSINAMTSIDQVTVIAHGKHSIKVTVTAVTMCVDIYAFVWINKCENVLQLQVSWTFHGIGLIYPNFNYSSKHSLRILQIYWYWLYTCSISKFSAQSLETTVGRNNQRRWYVQDIMTTLVQSFVYKGGMGS